jgi:hypothetical protein
MMGERAPVASLVAQRARAAPVVGIVLASLRQLRRPGEVCVLIACAPCSAIRPCLPRPGTRTEIAENGVAVSLCAAAPPMPRAMDSSKFSTGFSQSTRWLRVRQQSPRSMRPRRYATSRSALVPISQSRRQEQDRVRWIESPSVIAEDPSSADKLVRPRH